MPNFTASSPSCVVLWPGTEPLVMLLSPPHASHMTWGTSVSCDVQWPSRNCYSFYRNRHHSYDSSQLVHLLRSRLERKPHVTADSKQTLSWKPAIKHSSTFTSILYRPLISDLQTGSHYSEPVRYFHFIMWHMREEMLWQWRERFWCFDGVTYFKSPESKSSFWCAVSLQGHTVGRTIFVFSIQEFRCHASMPGEQEHPSSKNKDPSNVAKTWISVL
jgi:hypothetical protein